MDRFALLNKCNLSLQVPDATVLDLVEEKFRQQKLEAKKLSVCPTLMAHQEKSGADWELDEFFQDKEHLQKLGAELSQYFPAMPETPFAQERNSLNRKMSNSSIVAQLKLCFHQCPKVSQHIPFSSSWLRRISCQL